jgi:hypothetical protein
MNMLLSFSASPARMRLAQLAYALTVRRSNMPTSEDFWLTRPEVGERLKVPVKTLAQWASKGKGPRYASIGRYARYRLTDVIAWENEQFTGGAA